MTIEKPPAAARLLPPLLSARGPLGILPSLHLRAQGDVSTQSNLPILGTTKGGTLSGNDWYIAIENGHRNSEFCH